jgi:hypothetical protein
MSTKRCKIHYRRLNRTNGQFPDISLATALAQALDHKLANGESVRAKASNRMTAVPANVDYQRFLNHCHIEKDQDLVFGNVCLFSPGNMQALLQIANETDPHASLDDALRALDIAEQKAPPGMEYLHGITYWAVIGDHFYQIQHTSLPSKAMEEYLTWMLRDQTKIIGSSHYVELQAEFDREQVGKDLGDIRAIEIGGLVPETVRDDPSPPSKAGKVVEFEKHESLGDRVAQTFQSAKKILVDLLGDVEAQKLIESMPSEAALEVKVSIGYRARRRKFQKEFMSNLASGLRDLPDGQIRVRGRDGEIKGADARLSADMNIKRLSATSTLLDLEETLRQFKEVHRRFLHDGRIIA